MTPPRYLARLFRRIAARPWLAALLIGGSALLFAFASTAAHGFPPPREHDEYSYLLGAETFASGRLTNPTHPMWRHFETFHVLQQPSYNSKYPPANALFIAAGWVTTGHPIAGVWLSFAFMCAALYWMLRAWVGDRWALGVTLAFASWSSVSYWSYSYWGGAVAAGAGALMLGALFRIVHGRGRAGNAIIFGVGLVLLANSRPYEGLLLAIPAAIVLLRWLLRGTRDERAQKWRRVAAPLATVGVIGVACMARYNAAVTGNWHEMPYVAYQQSRAGAPLFVWQRPAPVATVTDPTMRAFMAWEDSTYRAARSPAGRLEYLGSLVTDFLALVIPLPLLLPLLLIPVAMRNWWTRFAVATGAWTVAGMGLSSYFNPHYAAPLVALVLAVYGASLRWLSRLGAGRVRLGNTLAVSIVVLWFLAGIGSTLRDLAAATPQSRAAGAAEWPNQRRLIADSLARRFPHNLVIVRYGQDHGSGDEWVYNAANIDASPVIWARDLGDRQNLPLLDYYRDRAAWIIDVNSDVGPYQVTRYHPQAE